MHLVHFSKAYAEDVLAAIQSGQPIPHQGDGWTGHAMLTLAGILKAAVLSQGPHAKQALGISNDELMKRHPEYREADSEALDQNVQLGINLVGMATFAVLDKQYDDTHEPEFKAIVYVKDGEPTMMPISGFKNIG